MWNMQFYIEKLVWFISGTPSVFSSVFIYKIKNMKMLNSVMIKICLFFFIGLNTLGFYLQDNTLVQFL